MVPQTPPLIDFFKQARTSDVAVLVSTGPSLGKQLTLLKEIAPYVTIFAVDASLPILLQNGIQPDVVTSVERVAETSRFFKEVPKASMRGIVTVLSSVQHADVIESVDEGEKIISLRPLGYIMLTGPKAWGYAGIGMSSANMAYELIYHSRFQTCILIGQDLAYSKEGKSHAFGHLFGENDVKESQGDGWAVAYGGEGRVKTTAFWNMFRGFFEKDIAETSKRMLTINATEGGARIFGAQELPFAQALSLHVKKNRVKTSLQLSRLAASEQKIILEEVARNVEEIKNYVMQWQKRVETLFLDVAHTCEALDAKQTVLIATLQVLLERIDAVQKARNEEMFDKVIWHIAQSMMLVQDIAIAPIEVEYVADEKSRYAKMTQLLYAYKSWLFALAGSMDAIVKTITYAQGRSLIHTVERIDVWVDDVRIDTLTCKDMRAQNGRVFDVEMRGILYDVPDEYLGQNVLFKDAKTSEMLPGNFVRVIERDDGSLNELRFAYGLDEPSKETMYGLNVISFFVIEENLNDKAFIDYISHLAEEYKEGSFKLFYFTQTQKNRANDLLRSLGDRKAFLSPKTVDELIQGSEVYLHNAIVKFENPNNAKFYNKLRYQTALKNRVFIIDVTKEFKVSKETEDLKLAFNHTIEFSPDLSIVKILKRYSKFTEYNFINSLYHFSKNQSIVKSSGHKNLLGLFATNENLDDLELKEHLVDFLKFNPHVKLKFFYFYEFQKEKAKKIFQEQFHAIEFCIPYTLDDIAQGCEIFLHNQLNQNFVKIPELLQRYSDFVYPLTYRKEFNTLTTIEFEQKLSDYIKNFLDNSEIYGFDMQVYEEFHSFYYMAEKQINNTFDFNFLTQCSLNKYLFGYRLSNILANEEYKNYWVSIGKKYLQIKEKACRS
ncbi:MAG: DUF115 domain-containing protein [Sulfurospirillum cavolei]|nr:DUF115 domain-containing protein [Sulfurospirillum cavolei]